MDCPVCTANAEQIATAIDRMGIICPTWANTMYRARSSLQKIGRDLIRMNAAMYWKMRSVRVSQACAQRSQTTCSQPTLSPARNRQRIALPSD
jgi:hypothetical protein